MSFHPATISTIFKDYNSLLMLHVTNKIPNFIGFMDLHASLHYQEYCQYHKYLLKLSEGRKLSKCSICKVQVF